MARPFRLERSSFYIRRARLHGLALGGVIGFQCDNVREVSFPRYVGRSRVEPPVKLYTCLYPVTRDFLKLFGFMTMLLYHAG